MLTHFDRFSDYLAFTSAKSFVYTENNTPFNYRQNRSERVGNVLTWITLKPLDFILRHSRNPLLIMTLTLVALCAATVLFYPSLFTGILSAAAIMVLKATTYSLVVTSITGLCIRTLGRLNNKDLMDEWDKKVLTAVKPGTILLTQK